MKHEGLQLGFWVCLVAFIYELTWLPSPLTWVLLIILGSLVYIFHYLND